MAPDPWHFARTDDARQTLLALTRGPIVAMSLFGARRTGKTEFLLRDLAPLAVAEGHRVVYASFWQSPAAPLAVLLYECDRALQPRNSLEKLSNWTSHLPVKAKLGGPNAAIEVDFTARQKAPPDDQVLLLDTYLDRLSNARRPALLLLDEAQELAKHPQGDIIMAALRTALDKRRDGLRSMFTGSSQLGLNKVFSARAAPFYRFATPVSLPPLGPGFVDFQCGVFRKVYRRRLSRDAAGHAFKRFRGNPFIFRQWLSLLGSNAGLTEMDAEARVLRDLAAQLDFDRVWMRFTGEQRAVARLLAERAHGLFGSAAEPRLTALIGQAPSPSARQSAIRLLQRQGRADQFDREWRLADPLFEEWVLDRAPEDF